MSEQSRIELEARRRDVEDFALLRAENDRLRDVVAAIRNKAQHALDGGMSLVDAREILAVAAVVSGTPEAKT